MITLLFIGMFLLDVCVSNIQYSLDILLRKSVVKYSSKCRQVSMVNTAQDIVNI